MTLRFPSMVRMVPCSVQSKISISLRPQLSILEVPNITSLGKTRKLILSSASTRYDQHYAIMDMLLSWLDRWKSIRTKYAYEIRVSRYAETQICSHSSSDKFVPISSKHKGGKTVFPWPIRASKESHDKQSHPEISIQQKKKRRRKKSHLT